MSGGCFKSLKQKYITMIRDQYSYFFLTENIFRINYITLENMQYNKFFSLIRFFCVLRI